MINVKSTMIIAISLVILCVGIYGIKYLIDIKQYKEVIEGIKITNVDLSKIKDGTYTGEFYTTIIGAEVNPIHCLPSSSTQRLSPEGNFPFKIL